MEKISQILTLIIVVVTFFYGLQKDDTKNYDKLDTKIEKLEIKSAEHTACMSHTTHKINDIKNDIEIIKNTIENLNIEIILLKKNK